MLLILLNNSCHLLQIIHEWKELLDETQRQYLQSLAKVLGAAINHCMISDKNDFFMSISND